MKPPSRLRTIAACRRSLLMSRLRNRCLVRAHLTRHLISQTYRVLAVARVHRAAHR